MYITWLWGTDMVIQKVHNFNYVVCIFVCVWIWKCISSEMSVCTMGIVIDICIYMYLKMYFVVFTFVRARTTVEEVLREVKWVCAHSHWQHRLEFDIYKLRLKSKHTQIQVLHSKLQSFIISFNILTSTLNSCSKKANVEMLKGFLSGGGVVVPTSCTSWKVGGWWVGGWFEKVYIGYLIFIKPQNVSKRYSEPKRFEACVV